MRAAVARLTTACGQPPEGVGASSMRSTSLRAAAARGLGVELLFGLEPSGVHDLGEAHAAKEVHRARSARPAVREDHHGIATLAELVRPLRQRFEWNAHSHPRMVPRKLAGDVDVHQHCSAREPAARLEDPHDVVMKHQRERAAQRAAQHQTDLRFEHHCLHPRGASDARFEPRQRDGPRARCAWRATRGATCASDSRVATVRLDGAPALRPLRSAGLRGDAARSTRTRCPVLALARGAPTGGSCARGAAPARARPRRTARSRTARSSR